MNEEELKDCIKEVEELCYNYEKWFYDKIGRNPKK